jgi:hypothetical protein
MLGEQIAVSLVLMTLLFSIVYIIRGVMESYGRGRSEKLEAELYSKMVDKFGTSQDLVAYLQTEAGQSFLKAAPPERARPFGRILNSVQAGLVLIALGVSLLAVRGSVGPNGQEPLAVFGTIALSLGIGLLASGGASWFLSKKLGLINGNRGEEK